MTDSPQKMRKHSVLISGHRTSVSLENAFWQQLQIIADDKQLSLNALITRIDANRTSNLSSAIRVFVLEKKL